MDQKRSKIGCGCISLLISAVICGYLFQYSLWVIFKRDLPWYIDLIGGIICNGLILIISFLCLLSQYLGYVPPLIK